MTKTIKIDFSVHAITTLGEEVYITGNLVELGLWNIHNGLKLQTSKQLYPQWRSRKPLQIHPNVSIQFKIFIKNSHGAVRWERIEENRKFVPTESVLINLSQSNMQMIFQPKIIQQQFIAVRKNTYQIIHDLSQEVSQQSSSGNEREFWMEKRAKERSTLSSSKQFVADAKLIYSAWIPERFKAKPRKVNDWLQLIPSIHYIIMKQSGVEKNEKIEINMERKGRHSSIFALQIGKKYNELAELQSLQQPEDTLKIFHLELDNYPWCKQIALTIRQNFQAEFVMYLNNGVQITNAQEDILEYAQIIVTRSKKLLKQCLQRYHSRKNHHISMLKQNQFHVKKDNNGSVVILFDASIPVLLGDQQLMNKHEYFSSIQKNIVGHKGFQLPQNLRISLLMEKNILSKIRNNRFCIIIMCQKLTQIPQKIITKLIRISSCENININFMTSDEVSEIFKRLPASEKDKLLAYNRHGQVFKPGKKSTNLYEQLHVNHKKYEETFKKLRNIANFWVENRQITIKQYPFSLQLFLPKNALGETLSQHFAHEFSKLDDINKYPYQIQRYPSSDKENYVVHVRPLLSSTEFYSRIITSINYSSQQTTYFFVFDYTKDKYKIIDKIHKGIGQRNSICEGFIMDNERGKGLKQQKFVQFLSRLMDQTYSIIQEDIEKQGKVGNKKDKNLIRSDTID